VTNFEPASNEFAQAAAVAGMAVYHTVIGPDGKPGEIAVARPIGFGLDENAVEAIRNARFEPAMKNGKAVPVLLDLVVQFRIFSKRTAVTDTPTPVDKTDSAPQPARTVAPALRLDSRPTRFFAQKRLPLGLGLFVGERLVLCLAAFFGFCVDHPRGLWLAYPLSRIGLYGLGHVKTVFLAFLHHTVEYER